MSNNYSEYSDKELFESLSKAGLSDKLENSPEWKMLREAADRIVNRAVNEFALKAKADDLTRITELQAIIRKYKYGLFDEVQLLKVESEFIYQEAKERGIIGNSISKLMEKILG